MPSNHLILLLPSPLALNLSQHQGLFRWVCSPHQVAKILELQLQHQSFQWMFMVWSPCCPRDSQKSSPAPQFKGINSLGFSLLYGQLSHLYMTTGKTRALTTWTFVGKVMSLIFNMLSRVVIFFSKKQAYFNFVVAVTILSDCPRKWNLPLFLPFSQWFAMKWWDQMPWS